MTEVKPFRYDIIDELGGLVFVVLVRRQKAPGSMFTRTVIGIGFVFECKERISEL